MATVNLRILDGKQPSLKRINKWVQTHHSELVREINLRVKGRKVIKIHKIHSLSEKLLWVDVEFDGLATDTDANEAAQQMWENGMRIGFNMVLCSFNISKKSSLVWV